ncbi:MAG: hypothetical protein HZC54_10970 [Verrucomicrobia bacterium]|nr:hypothetical protein [Verrucomicrobiota bacterium]
MSRRERCGHRALERRRVSQPRRALLIVSNLSLKDEPSASLSLDLQRLGLRETGLKARDALTSKSLALQTNRLTVPLPSMRMRMVWIE